jgi:NAD(P)-dependent dehydrogenase (short-subunit alcohol dehydrogenase family)
VLITGCLGDVGLVLARHLASKYGCRLVLTARTPLPRAEWQQFLAAPPQEGRHSEQRGKQQRGKHHSEQRRARHIRNILDLESRGAQVLAMSADVADLDQMRAVAQAAVDRFGGIDMVVHGAGVQDSELFNFAHLMDRAQCDAHLAAKVKGFHVLQTALQGHCPDRRITLSSLAAVLGGLTLAPYATANAALDAWPRSGRGCCASSRSAPPTTSSSSAATR